MPASEARIAANQANALKSTGPKTAEGKERSRANAVKHGLTGEGVALTVEDAAEVERRFRDFEAELKPSGEMGRTLVRRVALMAVRMDRCVEQETAAALHTSDRPRRISTPSGRRSRARTTPSAADAASRSGAVGDMFDPSKEACLARKYEAAAERGFFQSLKELRQVERRRRRRRGRPRRPSRPRRRWVRFFARVADARTDGPRGGEAGRGGPESGAEARAGLPGRPRSRPSGVVRRPVRDRPSGLSGPDRARRVGSGSSLRRGCARRAGARVIPRSLMMRRPPTPALPHGGEGRGGEGDGGGTDLWAGRVRRRLPLAGPGRAYNVPGRIGRPSRPEN